MKKVFLGLLFLISAFASFGQAGSQALSGVFLRVNDTTTYQTQAATRHAQGYYDIYFNNQAVTPHWDVWNGSSYDHVFDFNSGTSGPSTSHNNLPIEYRTDDFDLVPGDTSKLLVLDDGVGITLDLASAVDGSQFVWWNPSPSLPPGISAGGTVVLDTGLYTYAHYHNDTLRVAAGGGSGGSGGAVSSVFGRTGAVVATSGDYEADEITNTPAGTIAATDVQAALNELDTEKVPTSRTISTTSPLSGGGDLSANRTLTISDAAADGSTKGAASFTANDFNATSGNISIDYTNGQSAASGTKGFLTGTDWDTFNGKQATGLSYLLVSGGTLTGANTITGSTTNTVKYVFDGLGNTITNGAGLWLQNNTAAVAGGAEANQQRSPYLVYEGQGWKINATAASQSVRMATYLQPVQGSAAPTGTFVWAGSINGGAYSTAATLTTGGVMNLNQITGLSGSAGVSFGAGQTIGSASNTFQFGSLGGTVNPTIRMAAQSNMTLTSGTQQLMIIGNSSISFAPTSGTAVYEHVRMDGVVNQTGGANGAATWLKMVPVWTAAGGDATGIDYDPTVTSISGTHRAARFRIGHVAVDNGNLTLGTAGNKLLIKEGSNAALGQATLVGGTVTVNNTIVTANSKIFLTVETPGGTQGFLSYTKSAATSFTINSTSGTETSTVSWVIIEPAP